MNRLALAWLFSALLAGCGDVVIEGSGGSGGPGGSGGGGAATSSGTAGGSTATTLPPECAIATDQPAPYAVKLQFVVAQGQSAFLIQGCHTQLTVTSCADGYEEPIGLHPDCTLDCAQSTDCIACEACPFFAVQVLAGAPHVEAWTGEIFDFSTSASGCYCHTRSDAPAGKYRIDVPVYPTEQDALAQQNGAVVSHDFELPAPDGLVVVPVGLQPN